MRQMRLIICLSIFTGCFPEDPTHTHITAIIRNETPHEITILFFKSGVVLSDDTVKLFPDKAFMLADYVDKGRDGGGFFSEYFGDSNDSVRVVFDNLYVITHYANEPSKLNSKYYLFDSKRNILHNTSYSFVERHASKHGWESEYTYTFTEQDYLDAK